MGWFDKHNPEATPKSVAIHGCIGFAIGTALSVIVWNLEGISADWRIGIAVVATIVSTGVQALLEWQKPPD